MPASRDRRQGKCRHCDYRWFYNAAKPPMSCPACRRTTWNRPEKKRGRPKLSDPPKPQLPPLTDEEKRWYRE